MYQDATNIGLFMSMDHSEVKTNLLIKHAFLDGKKVFLPKCKYQSTLLASPSPATSSTSSLASSSSDLAAKDAKQFQNTESPPFVVTQSLNSANSSLDSSNQQLPHHLIPEIDFSKSSKKTHLILYNVPNYETVASLKPQGPYKLREPLENSPHSIHVFDQQFNGLDLLIVPAVAFAVDSKEKKISRLGHGAGFYDEFIKRHCEFVDYYNEKLKKENGEDGNGAVKLRKYPFLLGVGLEEQMVDTVPTDDHDRNLDGLIVQDSFYHFD